MVHEKSIFLDAYSSWSSFHLVLAAISPLRSYALTSAFSISYTQYRLFFIVTFTVSDFDALWPFQH
jgi:hypothetical protein